MRLLPGVSRPGQNTVVTVESGGVATPGLVFPVIAEDPGVFFIQPSSSKGQGAILNQDGTVNSISNPAALGSVISIFGTGMGALIPIPQDGEFIPDANHLIQQEVHVYFAGLDEGQIIYAGAAPTLVAGVMQINVRLPGASSSVPANQPTQVGIYMLVGDGPQVGPLCTVAVQ